MVEAVEARPYVKEGGEIQTTKYFPVNSPQLTNASLTKYFYTMLYFFAASLLHWLFAAWSLLYPVLLATMLGTVQAHSKPPFKVYEAISLL